MLAAKRRSVSSHERARIRGCRAAQGELESLPNLRTRSPIEVFYLLFDFGARPEGTLLADRCSSHSSVHMSHLALQGLGLRAF